LHKPFLQRKKEQSVPTKIKYMCCSNN